MSIQDRKDFIAELRNSRVILCKRAACSLSAAIAEDVENKKRITELESLLKRVSQDLLMRAELDSDGFKVVDLSSSIWINLKEAIKEQE